MNIKIFLLVFVLLFFKNCFATPNELQQLKTAYPDLIKDVSLSAIHWKDGSETKVYGSFPIFESLGGLLGTTTPNDGLSINDLRCDSYELFFKKMYGSTPQAVHKNLVTIYWMPNVFGKQFPLRVTKINGVDKKLQRISSELEKLPKSYFKYLAKPAGAYYWRQVKGEGYLSAHSFGIAMDINSHFGNYWEWDWEKAKRPHQVPNYRNNIPMKIVEIFEKEGFLWGGRWHFYDTMHFEYRPELFANKKTLTPEYIPGLEVQCAAKQGRYVLNRQHMYAEN